jgi:hypothetical protein
MARIDRLTPYVGTRPTKIDGALHTRPVGICVGCREHINHISNYNPAELLLHDGRICCTYCAILLHKAERYGWRAAEDTEAFPGGWNPWPPDEEQLSAAWNGHELVDYRGKSAGPAPSSVHEAEKSVA